MSAYYCGMNEELTALASRIQAMTEINYRLAQQNAALKAQLAESERAYELTQVRLELVRNKVETALSRLPVITDN